MNMKRLSLITSIVLLLAFAAGTVAAQGESGYDLYQRALVKERAVGDVEEALRLYQRIVHEFGSNHALAAKAQYRLALLYDRLGRRADAQRNYQAVVNNYSDQSDTARQARARIEVAPRTNGAAKAKANSAGDKWARNMATRQVWAGGDVDPEGAPSFDGNYLSFVDWETGDLAVRDLTTGQKRHLTNKGSWLESNEFALYSVPSADGNQIAYTWFNKDLSFDLRLVRVDGSKPKVLYRNDEVEYIQPSQWSVDGKQILALINRKDHTSQIVLISVADGSARMLKTLDWRYPLRMGFSPDSRFVVYDFPPQEKFPNRDIFLLATDGSRETPLVQHPANDFFPIWTPDGKRILFVSDRTGALGLWSVAVVGGKPQGPPSLVKGDIGQMFPMGFTGNGALFYTLQTGMKDVYTATFDFSAGRLLEPPATVSQRFVGSNRFPDWSPDGKYLSYISQRTPGPQYRVINPIIIRNLATGEEREVVPALAISRRPRWWPDGRAFVIVSEDFKGRVAIYRVDAQTGAASPLVQLEPTRYFAPSVWSSDGKQIFYYYPKGKEQALRVRNLESGEEKELYRGNLGQLAISPDSQWLAFTMSSGNLMIMPITGGNPRELLQVRPPESIRPNELAWTRDGQYLLFVKAQPRPQQQASLWRISVKGGEPQPLGLKMEGISDLRLHPDGRQLAFSAGEDTREIWVMENFLPAAQKGKASVAKR
jgi:Tol biopolymer transport system component